MQNIKRISKNILLLFVFSYSCLSQECLKKQGLDSIDIGGDTLLINIPMKSVKSIFKYEEGMIITYFSKQDSGVIIIHIGSTAALNLGLDSSVYQVISEQTFGNFYKDIRGIYRIGSNTNHFRIIKVTHQNNIPMFFYYITKDDYLYHYEKSFNNIKYKKHQ